LKVAIADAETLYITQCWYGYRGVTILRSLTRFSCNFGFQQEVGDLSILPGVDPFYDGDGVDTSLSDPCSDSTPCYITEGANGKGVLSVEYVSADSDNYQDYIATGADSDNFEDYDRYSGSGTTDDDIQNPFTQFPGASSADLSGDSVYRNPLVVCQLNGECPNPYY
jgi:hypothetical protein